MGKLNTSLQLLKHSPEKRKKGDKSKMETEKEKRKKQNPSEDGIYNYVCRIMGMNLMARNFHDASRYNDGELSAVGSSSCISKLMAGLSTL